MANRPNRHHADNPPARALYSRDESAMDRGASESDSGGSSKSGGRLSWFVWIILAIGVCAAVIGVMLGEDESQDMPPRIAVILPTETPKLTPTAVVRYLAVIAQESESLAMSLMEAAWLADGVSEEELAVLKYLAIIDKSERRAVQSIINIAATDSSEDLEMPLMEAAWFTDGVSEYETEVVRNLVVVAQESDSLAMSLMEAAWLADGVSEEELAVLRYIHAIAQESEALSTMLTEAAWLADGVSGEESATLKYLARIARESKALTLSLMETAWFTDGVSEEETATLGYLARIARESETLAMSLIGMSWFADGVSEIELDAMKAVRFINSRNASMAALLMGMSWLADDVSGDESEVVRDLSILSQKDMEATANIIAMPFLASLESPDVSAVEALTDLATFSPDDFSDAMSRPALADGITDFEAPIVAMLEGVYGTEPDLVDVLLDPSQVYVERKTARLPLSGDVVIVIVRTKPGAQRSMALIENAVRTAEDLMARPLPTNYVGVLFEEATWLAGANFGTHIAIRSKYDVDDGSHDAALAPSAVAHEVAHYYWRGNAGWVDEGMANLMEATIENRRDRKPIGATTAPCPFAKNVEELQEELQRLDSSRARFPFLCNYSLGERLFLDLRRTLGENAFWNAARHLYDMSLVNDMRGGTSMIDISHVRMAFGDESESAAKVISRWYNGTESHDLSGLDASAPNPKFSAVNGQIDSVSVLMPDIPYVKRRFKIDYSFGQVNELRKIHLNAVESYEDGFEFWHMNVEITANPGDSPSRSSITVYMPTPFEGVATGRYWVYIYEGENKLAEATYEVVP